MYTSEQVVRLAYEKRRKHGSKIAPYMCACGYVREGNRNPRRQSKGGFVPCKPARGCCWGKATVHFKSPPALRAQLPTPVKHGEVSYKNARPKRHFPLNAQHQGSHSESAESTRSRRVGVDGRLVRMVSAAPPPPLILSEQKEGGHAGFPEPPLLSQTPQKKHFQPVPFPL